VVKHALCRALVRKDAGQVTEATAARRLHRDLTIQGAPWLVSRRPRAPRSHHRAIQACWMARRARCARGGS